MSSCVFERIVLPVIFVLLVFFCTMPVLAGDDLEVWGTVKPEGSLEPGADIVCYYTIQYAFDSDAESIEFYTDLSDAIWQFSTVMDGARQEMPRRFGRYETITGFELYYPRVYQTLIEVKLNGTVPSVANTGNYSIFSVTHYDAGGIAQSSENVERIFLNPSELTGVQNSMEIKLSNLRSEIDGLYILGVDTTAAEEKYSDASDAISAAKYSSPSVQSGLLSSSDSYIAESRAVLDVSWAEHSINLAKQKINSVESMVNYFESSKGLSGDSRVWVIKSYNDNAKTLLVLAEDKYHNFDYIMTRDYAGQAEEKANEAYGYAVSFNNELDLGAPVQTGIWVTPTPAATYVSQSSSPTSSVNIGGNTLDTDGLDDIDTLLHSDVDLESFLKIAGKIADLLLSAFDFLNNLIAAASDN